MRSVLEHLLVHFVRLIVLRVYLSRVFRLSALTLRWLSREILFLAVSWLGMHSPYLPGTWLWRLRSVLLLAGIDLLGGQRRLDTGLVETSGSFATIVRSSLKGDRPTPPAACHVYSTLVRPPSPVFTRPYPSVTPSPTPRGDNFFWTGTFLDPYPPSLTRLSR